MFGEPLDYETCWRCGAQIGFPWGCPALAYIHRTAYGWCCQRCLVGMAPAEYRAMLTMNELAAELEAAAQ